nr:hypothetical protein [Tanacetum cinerariifolium]
MRKGLPCVCFQKKGSYARICMNVTPLQEERLTRLKNRTKVYFDSTRLEHQGASNGNYACIDCELDDCL